MSGAVAVNSGESIERSFIKWMPVLAWATRYLLPFDFVFLG